MSTTHRFRGRIAGVGSASGVRVVVGWWAESPWGGFADAMVERPDGHRVLLAPTDDVARFVAGTYTVDEVRVEPFSASVDAGPPRDGPGSAEVAAPRGASGVAQSWRVRSPALELDLAIGDRTPLGRLLRLVPRAAASSPGFAALVDPVARVLMNGVRTRGTARAGRREYYGATDVHAVAAMSGTFDGTPLGTLAPVDPPCRFGFASTPSRPSVTDVVTTIVDLGPA